MAEIISHRKLPPGWLFAVRWGIWIGGLIDATILFANNDVNLKLIKQLDSQWWTKRFIALAVHKADVSYDAGTQTVIVEDNPTVIGRGYDTLHPALDKIRQTILDQGGADPGDLKNAKRYFQVVGTILET
jgi:hypothetical protein